MSSGSTLNSSPGFSQLLEQFLRPGCSGDDIVLEIVLDIPVRKKEVTWTDGTTVSDSAPPEINVFEKREIELGRILLLQSSGSCRVKVDPSLNLVKEDLQVIGTSSQKLQSKTPSQECLTNSEESGRRSCEDLSTKTESTVETSIHDETSSTTVVLDRQHEDMSSAPASEDVKKVIDDEPLCGPVSETETETSVQVATDVQLHRSEHSLHLCVPNSEESDLRVDTEVGPSTSVEDNDDQIKDQCHLPLSPLNSPPVKEASVNSVVSPKVSQEVCRVNSEQEKPPQSILVAKEIQRETSQTRQAADKKLKPDSFAYYLSQKYPNTKEGKIGLEEGEPDSSIYAKYLRRYLESGILTAKEMVSDNPGSCEEERSVANVQDSCTEEELDEEEDQVSISGSESTNTLTNDESCGDTNKHSFQERVDYSRFVERKSFNETDSEESTKHMRNSYELGDAEKYLKKLETNITRIRQPVSDTQSIKRRMRRNKILEAEKAGYSKGISTLSAPLVAVNEPVLSRCYNFFLEEAKLRKAYGISHIYKELSQVSINRDEVQQDTDWSTYESSLPEERRTPKTGSHSRRSQAKVKPDTGKEIAQEKDNVSIRSSGCFRRSREGRSYERGLRRKEYREAMVPSYREPVFTVPMRKGSSSPRTGRLSCPSPVTDQVVNHHERMRYAVVPRCDSLKRQSPARSWRLQNLVDYQMEYLSNTE